jgi:hypothetical protein
MFHLLTMTMLVTATLLSCRAGDLVPVLDDRTEAPPAAAADTTPPETVAAGTSSAEEDPAPVPAVDPAIDDLLTRIEASAQDLRTFSSAIRYQSTDALLGQKKIRTGTLLYELEPDTKQRKLAIAFTTFIENGRRRTRNKIYIFRDRWLVEVLPDERQFFKREIAPPSEQYDPFALGEGPFPLPVAQPKAEVLERFDVTMIDLPETGMLATLNGENPPYGLRLTPKPRSSLAEQIAYVDLFYDRKSLLPVGVDLREPNGDRKTARLDDLHRNFEFDDTTQQRFSIDPPDDPSWQVSIERLQPAES